MEIRLERGHGQLVLVVEVVEVVASEQRWGVGFVDRDVGQGPFLVAVSRPTN
jgi:hypothetical protein